MLDMRHICLTWDTYAWHETHMLEIRHIAWNEAYCLKWGIYAWNEAYMLDVRQARFWICTRFGDDVSLQVYTHVGVIVWTCVKKARKYVLKTFSTYQLSRLFGKQVPPRSCVCVCGPHVHACVCMWSTSSWWYACQFAFWPLVRI
jgi:hypothetical protein